MSKVIETEASEQSIALWKSSGAFGSSYLLPHSPLSLCGLGSALYLVAFAFSALAADRAVKQWDRAVKQPTATLPSQLDSTAWLFPPLLFCGLFCVNSSAEKRPFA